MKVGCMNFHLRQTDLSPLSVGKIE